MSEPITDRIAFRVESNIIDGVAQVSFSGFFDPKATLIEKDAIVDELMAVAERQRAMHIQFQVQAQKDANKRVLDQEKERMGKVLADGETQSANGGMHDATAQAIRASQQNVQRLENEDLKFQAQLESLKPLLRESAQPEGA